ncbi:MAG TPA: ArsR family transcriptional regulator [Candidatus Aenigmarchaeota archaeon]|nr:MAG: ArsR family transcriptional regulator [Candidatus Aenigmarchaeota archaeon]HDD46015.1 ArsR family transcriptional regulator [Candidatus Aenigmarchaeota archaeon]
MPRGVEIKILKAISNHTRIKIIEFLRSGEKSVNEITRFVKKSQPTVSLHLKILKDAGLVREKRLGNVTLYRIIREEIYKILNILRDKRWHV